MASTNLILPDAEAGSGPLRRAPGADTEVPWPAGWSAAQALITSRRNVSPRRLAEPAPSFEQLQSLLTLAASAPDHGQLTPWRFVVVPGDKRGLLAEAFALALIDRDPGATLAQIEAAREKAYRAPLLVLAIAALSGGSEEITATDRLVSLGAAIQNVLLGAQAMGVGAGLTSGRSIASTRVRALFAVREGEEPVCFISMGTPGRLRERRERPHADMFVTEL